MYTQHIPASPPNVSVKENMAFIRQKFGRITGPIDQAWIQEGINYAKNMGY